MPEELAGPYRATLTKLQESGPPMGADRVHEILARELGPRWASTKLVEFDDVPAAAASIGQVHKGVWRDGREVAGEDPVPRAPPRPCSPTSTRSRGWPGWPGSWVPGIDVKPIMDELKARMSEELDYHLEARNQRHFADRLPRRRRRARPRRARRVRPRLVTEWVDGTPLSRIITEGTQEQRDEAATALPRVPPARAQPSPGCSTPTRTPATSGSPTTAGSGCSTSGRSTGCRTGLPSLARAGAHRGARG